MDSIKKYHNSSPTDNCFDKFGFECSEDSEQSYAEQLISDLLDTNAVKHWTDNCQSIKCLIRQFGIPNALRANVWFLMIKTKIGDTYDVRLFYMS